MPLRKLRTLAELRLAAVTSLQHYVITLLRLTLLRLLQQRCDAECHAAALLVESHSALHRTLIGICAPSCDLLLDMERMMLNHLLSMPLMERTALAGALSGRTARPAHHRLCQSGQVLSGNLLSRRPGAGAPQQTPAVPAMWFLRCRREAGLAAVVEKKLWPPTRLLCGRQRG